MKELLHKRISHRRSLFQHVLTAILSLFVGGGFLFSPTESFAQKHKISGIVTDASGSSLPGVSVVVKENSTIGVSTGANGEYTLEVPAGATLVYSFLGFQTQEQAVGSRSRIDVVLKDDALALDDVVVIGYGTQRKGDVTSAVASVKAEDFTVGNLQDASDMIRGKVAGLNITKSSGDPNAGSTIRLRGTTTINGDLTPLILVDGIPGDMNTVAPENIIDISVLKDASAAAIYGTRGANGVILITTKTGQRGESFSASYSGYVAASSFAKKADFMGVAEIADITAKNTAFPDLGYSTDWLKEITRTGFTHNHSVSVSGGTKSMTYAANVTYRDEKGVIKKTDREELKMQFDISQYLFKDILRLNFNIVKAIHKNTDSDPAYAYRQALIRNPTAPIYNTDADGYEDATLGYHEEFGRLQYYNPVSLLNEAIGDTQNEWTKMAGNITLEPIKGWQTNLMLATNRSNSMSEMYYTSRHYTLLPGGYKGRANKSQKNSKEDFLELTSRYDRVWNSKHRFSALIGYSYNYNMYQGFSAGNTNFPTEVFLYNNLGTGTWLTDEDHNASMSSDKDDNKLIGFFARVSYGFDDRYNVLVSFRREGSSKFGKDHKWGNFPSVSLGWNIHNEHFMANTSSWLDNLKLRAGWGRTGIIPGDSYASLRTYGYDTYNKYVGADGQWHSALAATQNYNPNLAWETSEEFNVGVDFGFLGNRLNGSIDFYNKTTDGLLYSYAVPLPPNYYNYTLANVGVMKNTGIEIVVNAVPVRTKKFEWNTTVTMSHNSNKLKSLSNDLYTTADYLNTGGVSDPVSVPTHRVEVGRSTGEFWGLKSVGGVSKSGKWIVELPDGSWKEFNETLNSDEYRQYLGSGVPKVYLNWGNTFRFFGFDLSVQLSSQLGFKILNNQRLFYQNNSIMYNRLKIAAKELPVYDITTHEATGATKKLATSQTQCFISEFLEDGDYLKLDNITLGYTFNTGKLKYLKNARVYFSMDNLACWTGYTGLDPEIENGNPFWGAGIDDRDKYPTIRSFTFGVNLTF